MHLTHQPHLAFAGSVFDRVGDRLALGVQVPVPPSIVYVSRCHGSSFSVGPSITILLRHPS